MRLVPTARFLWFFALVGVPCAGALGFPSSQTAGIAGLGILGVLALLDAFLAFSGTPDVLVSAPETVRLAKDRAGALPLTFRRGGEHPPALTLRVGAAFPREIKGDPDTPEVLLPADHGFVTWSWTVTPRRRGKYLLETLHLEFTSPFGLWARRTSQSCRCELRVYPDLRRDRKQVAAFFLPRAGLGTRRRRMIGKGREFEKLREYVHGDPPEDIHWKATARRRRPIVREYQIERMQEVYVILDSSRLSARLAPYTAGAEAIKGAQVARHSELDDGDLYSLPPEPPTTLERCLQSAILLGDVAQRQGDLFGLVTFADRVESFVRARNGVAHHQACREALYALQPRMVSPDYSELCAFLRTSLRKRALLVFLTALDDPVLAESFVKNVGLLTRQHVVLLPMVRPPEARPLFGEDPAVTPVADLDSLYARFGGHLRWRALQQTAEQLRRSGVRFSLLDQESMTAQLIGAYLEVKARQVI